MNNWQRNPSWSKEACASPPWHISFVTRLASLSVTVVNSAVVVAVDAARRDDDPPVTLQ